tara:strand:+ start:12891 stop:13361 length:471 start_codon:yes stop_codon:yes gene_type:complete
LKFSTLLIKKNLNLLFFYRFFVNLIFHTTAVLVFCVLFVCYFSKVKNESIYFFNKQLNYSCQFKKIKNIECGSCGLSRSWVFLSRGEIKKSYFYNNNGVITFIMSNVYLLSYILLLNKTKNKRILLIKSCLILSMFISWIGIIVSNYKLKTYDLFL